MVARHSHLYLATVCIGELVDVAGYVSCTEVELWTVTREEWGVTAALFLSKNVNLTGELLVWSNGTRLAENLTALDVLALNTTKKNTNVVASLAEVHSLTEHLNAGSNRVLSWLNTNDLDWIVELELTTLNTAGSNGTTTRNGHDVLDCHQEWLLVVTSWCWDVGVNSVHELTDGLNPLLLAVKSAESGTTDDWKVIAWEVVLGEKVTGLHLDEVDELVIVDHVALVQEDDDVRNADLTCKKDVLTSLSHRTIGCSNNEDCAVHLSCTRNHVLDVVCVARAVDVSVMALPSLVLNVSNGNGNTTLTLLWSLIDVLEGGIVCLAALGLRENLGDCCGKGSLTVVDVTNGTDVYVWLCAVKLFLGHCQSSFWN